ncbi:MAG: AAA-like domain-containing protein [Clostridiales bacterium]|jgi:Holliday junction resolvase|nr:AAA-like domain-containing protein [Clostridiales bacterium]
MKRIFNIAGPCNPRKHYMIDAMRRLGDEARSLIDSEQYFIIHAARQSGKTTLLLNLTQQLNSAGEYYALYCSLENAEGLTDAQVGISSIIGALKAALEGNGFPKAASFAAQVDLTNFSNALQRSLTDYCRLLDKPLVLFFDEADCPSGQTLITFLRQLRNGYVSRQLMPFVHSLALVGMRSIRDYRDEYRQPEHTLGSASPFNIAKKSMTMRNFTSDEIAELYVQHTADTGQVFEGEAVELVWRQTQGQPWLVNAIACETVENITANQYKMTVTAEMVANAVQTLILKRDAHFDSLMTRLKEERVRLVIEPVITGKIGAISRFSDGYNYVKDMGLIRDDRNQVELANPIYTEIIVRTLNWDTQQEIAQSHPPYELFRYLHDDQIDIDCLMSDFQVFWRENSDIWRHKYDYQEAAPHLILQAFLQRVLNGGGQIIRELAAGTGRSDLCIIYQGRKYPIELKIRHDDQTYIEGKQQILRYMDKLGCNDGWLVVFDQRQKLTWKERLFVKKEKKDDKTVMIYGC